MKRKQFLKGINQLSEEGAIQIYKRPNTGVEELIVGVVGVLQFEVLEYRLKNEYGVDILMHKLPYGHIRWSEMENFNYSRFSLAMDTVILEDKDQNPVILLQNEWSVRNVLDRNEGLVLRETSRVD